MATWAARRRSCQYFRTDQAQCLAWRVLRRAGAAIAAGTRQSNHRLSRSSPACCFSSSSARPGFRRTSKVRLREWLTHDLLDQWLAPKRAYLLTQTGESGANPDQYIQADARHLAETSATHAFGLLQCTLLLISFIGVLWALSSNVIFYLQRQELHDSRLHGLVRTCICRSRVAAHVAGRQAIDQAQCRTLCARSRPPLCDRARQ